MLIHVLLVGMCALFTMSGSLFAAPQKNAQKRKALNLSLGDRKHLEDFLRRILFAEGFAYTLFGDKPISSGCFELDQSAKLDSYRSRLPGYRVFEKYADSFPKEQFLFLFYDNLEQGYCEVTLINKKSFHLVVDKHKEQFSKVFGFEIDSEQLLNLLIQKRSLWNTLMKHHDDLIGILLGFGEINAGLFQKRREIVGGTGGINRKRVTPSPGYDSVSEELAAIDSSLQSFSNERRDSLYYMYLPGFVADPHHSETIELKKKYKEQRKRITQHYSQGNIIEITLDQLYAE